MSRRKTGISFFKNTDCEPGPRQDSDLGLGLALLAAQPAYTN